MEIPPCDASRSSTTPGHLSEPERKHELGTCDRRYHGGRGAVRPGAVAPRAAGSGLLNERAPLQMADVLYRRVCSSLSAGRFPPV